MTNEQKIADLFLQMLLRRCARREFIPVKHMSKILRHMNKKPSFKARIVTTFDYRDWSHD